MNGPKCDDAMEQITYGSIEVLDAGEFTDLLDRTPLDRLRDLLAPERR